MSTLTPLQQDVRKALTHGLGALEKGSLILVLSERSRSCQNFRHRFFQVVTMENGEQHLYHLTYDVATLLSRSLTELDGEQWMRAPRNGRECIWELSERLFGRGGLLKAEVL